MAASRSLEEQLTMNSPGSNQNLATDIVVIGSGPGGYVAAIRLGQLGKSVTIVEKDKIGGVCLNVGCIPSKALITAGKLAKNARNASKMGIDASISVNMTRLQEWKQTVVQRLTSGVSVLLKTYKVRVLEGNAKFLSGKSLSVESSSNQITHLNFNQAIIATGSSPIEIPSAKFDGKRIISSTEALSLSEPPKRLLIVGGGVIGLEIGMAYANLFGAELMIVELLDQLLPGVDLELVNVVSRSLQKLNAKIYLKSKVKGAVATSEGAKVTFETPEGKEITTEVDHVLVSVGRRPNSSSIGLEKAGVDIDSKGFIKVNKQMSTSAPNIFAIGDVVGGPLLAHKASREGIVAAEVISGMNSSFDNVAIPSVIFTDPEIAIVGMSPAEVSSKGIISRTGKFPFVANGRALSSLETEGFTKILAEKESGLLLGVGIVGQEASDLISETTLAIEMGATLEDLALTIHPHPTLPETIMEAAENALGRAIHITNRPVS
ncbi:MAG TPA: dihydrolipoyl dehydrogenase [Nitrososphaerales archaeon]|nr:dihydrolipoyl dehydrogenase [Nitrososphaerales archaeon]